MLTHLRRSVILSVIFIALLGLAYPLAGTGISQLLFKDQANGSLTADGSTLIGQQWSGPTWFQGRPDGTVVTTGPGGVVVSGTNQPGPRSKSLEQSVAKEAARLKKEGIVPENDLVTTSGSLVDPDISPAGAYAQVKAVAKARGLSIGVVHQLVADNVHTRELGFLGADYVDVLELNMALAQIR
ncbi:MAG TPA: potassium-transporting ATPase subunit C [Acidimicrobiales bacterium]|nr:potassium-transporting ATPase subunit C [Acidimicrobiales bacterium]